MNKTAEAKEIFGKGLNCAQSVLYVYGKEVFKEDISALRLASAFGAGISYRGEMCGAVSGALMVIGLRYGYTDKTIETDKENLFRISGEFIDMFEKQNGSVICNKLVGCEINTPEGLQYARQMDLFRDVCPMLVGKASEILDHIFRKYPLP